MKKILLYFVLSAISLLIVSCNGTGPEETGGPSDKDNENDGKVSLVTTVIDSDFDNITIKFEAGGGVVSVDYAVVPFHDRSVSIDDFKAGSLEDIRKVTSFAEPLVVPCDSVGPYLIYSMPIGEKGERGEVQINQVMAAPVSFEITALDCAVLEASVRVFDNDEYAKIGVYVMSREVFDFWGYDLQGFLENQIKAGTLDIYEPGEGYCFRLNGDPDYRHIVMLAAIDADGAGVDYYSFDVVSPLLDENLTLPDAPEVEITDVTATSVSIDFAVDRNARAQFYGLFTKERYEEAIESMPSTYPTLEEYLSAFAAFYGSFFFTEATNCTFEKLSNDNSIIPSGTECVIIGACCNGNGNSGLSVPTIVEFTTK